ncbi:MAG: hypothetical protein SF029_20455 [bacterium]|nr:hypothetical protein [bacterium]
MFSAYTPGASHHPKRSTRELPAVNSLTLGESANPMPLSMREGRDRASDELSDDSRTVKDISTLHSARR